MPTPTQDPPLVARQHLVDQVIDRLLRPDDVRESPKSFVQPGFYGVAGIGKSRLLHAIETQARTVTPYVVAFDFDRRAADVPGTPWGFLLRLIQELAAIDHRRRHWWQRLRWKRVNPFRACEAIIAQTGAPTAITQTISAAGGTIEGVRMSVESLA